MSLKRRKDVIAVPLGPLDSLDRVAMVRKDLALYGKKLEESAFNNQVIKEDDLGGLDVRVRLGANAHVCSFHVSKMVLQKHGIAYQ